MDAFQQVFEQARHLVENQAPADLTVPITAAGVGLVVLGLGMSVLGARLARISITGGFILAGIASGFAVCQYADVPQGVAVPLGGVVFGVLGFVLHRLWVGIATGVALVVALNGTYGVHTVAPHLASYTRSAGAAPAVFPAGLDLSELDSQTEYVAPEFKQWASGLRDHVRDHDSGGLRKLALISGCVGLFGLTIGLLAARLTVVTITSLVGTVMIASGAAALVRHWQPDLYQAGIERPSALGIACGVFLLVSLVLQTLLTRRNKSSAPAPTP